MPGEDELARLTANAFRGTSTDWSRYRDILNALGVDPRARILDFGASWGYGSWQLAQAGYNVTAFEISRPRCRYAREKLGVDAYDDLTQIEGTFDVVFSAHVMEHVPSVAETIEYARSVLFPGGLFIAFTPNGNAAFRRANPLVWHKMWGQVHPQFLDDRFYMKAFHGSPLLLTSDPFDLGRIASWSKAETMTFGLGGPELLVVARHEWFHECRDITCVYARAGSVFFPDADRPGLRHGRVRRGRPASPATPSRRSAAWPVATTSA